MKQEIKPFKISSGLTPEQSEIIQKKLFECGYCWGGWTKEVKHTTKGSITLSCDDNHIYYNPENDSPKITYQQFYAMYIERYFRLITQKGWPFPFFIKDKIYKGTLEYEQKGVGKGLISTYVKAYPKDWEEVTYEDYIKQEEKMNKLTELPKYWVVDFNENREECKKHVIPYLNKKYNQSWMGTNLRYYGYDGSTNYNGTNCFVCLTSFINNPVLLTLEDFIRLTSKKEFVLTEKWCIKVTAENKSFLQTTNDILFEKNYDYTIGGYYSHYRGYLCLPEDHIEITLDQFKKYVLKQDNMKVEVSAELIKEAHKDSTPVWKNRWEKECPELFTTYKRGQRFVRGDNEYILAQTTWDEVNMINVDSGRMYSDNVSVKDVSKITREELNSFLADGFKLEG